MFEKTQLKEEDAEPPAETMSKVLLDVVRGIIYESHEPHVDYEEESLYEPASQEQSRDGGGSGQSVLPMLLVGVALGAIGYLYGKRSRSGGKMVGESSERIQSATDEAADRTKAVAGSAAETVRESGEELSERADETAEQIEEKGEEVGDQVEEGGSKAADEMEDGD